METITVTLENLGQEHICCALSNDKDPQVLSKKAWLSKRFADGLVFLKGNVRGKCFIEYIPAEAAWVPIEAPGYMHINCFWVSGQHKGKGWSNILLERCVADSKAKGKRGLVMLSSPYTPTIKEAQGQGITSSSKGKKPYLIEPQFLVRHGFKAADTADPFFVLYYLPFDDRVRKTMGHDSEVLPRFKDCVSAYIENTKGYALYYTDQCPFTAKYVPLIEAMAKAHGAPFEAIHLATREMAQNAPCPFTTYSLYFKGRFVTNETLSENRFTRMLEGHGFRMEGHGF